MKYSRLGLKLLLWSLLLLGATSCSRDYLEPQPVIHTDGFRLILGGPLTRSSETDAVVEGMRLYCFTQGGGAVAGEGGSWMSPFHHYLTGVTHSGMTLKSSQMRAGNWDMVMVSGLGADLVPPIEAYGAGSLLMYAYDPGAVKADGSRAPSNEIWHRMLRLPTVGANGQTTASCGISRNVAMVQVIVERAVDVSTSATDHTVTLHHVPAKISWAGTLLRTVLSGVYQTSTSNPDTLAAPLTGRVTFAENSSVEKGTYKSDTLTFIIPAHRERDFWMDANTQNERATDTITHKMNLSVAFTKASGGKFVKTVRVPMVARCNHILQLKLRMTDASVEIIPTVEDWEQQTINGDVRAPYLNVSNVETAVYDASVSRIHFWSNQPADSVYVEQAGKKGESVISDIDTEFDRLRGAYAANYSMDAATKSGYIDISSTNMTAGKSEIKIYLKAGSLRREITVKRDVSTQAAKRITTPYVGTFHRWNQRGERIITWSYSGDWTAFIDDAAPGGAGADVLIDRRESPGMATGQIYTTTPLDPEQCKVFGSQQWVSGSGPIYFRVGWRTNAPNPSVPRYATITVRRGINNEQGAVIQRLYLRQGEAADYVMRPQNDAINSGGVNSATRSEARKFTPLNLTAAMLDAPVDPYSVRGANSAKFTDYPTQAGALFQWASNSRARYAYNPHTVNSALPWDLTTQASAAFWSDLRETQESCPSGYRRPNDGSITEANPTGAVSGSEMRQSLWLTPQAGLDGSDTSNSVWGYYADGFFDRRATEIGVGTGAQANSAVSASTKEVAYVGNLFFNPSTNASLFFPATGFRNGDDGTLRSAGAAVDYWSSSVNGTAGNVYELWALYGVSGASVAQSRYSHRYAHAIRCIESPLAILTFDASGAGGKAPEAIVAKAGTVVSLPFQGALIAPRGKWFTGWNTSPYLNGTTYASGDSYPIPEDGATLYAVWAEPYATFENGMAVVVADMLPNAEDRRNFMENNRVPRHTTDDEDPAHENVSRKFAVSYNDINEDGLHQTNATMNWAVAAGWDPLSANQSLGPDSPSETGCVLYQGYLGNDPPGSWRLPSYNEHVLIAKVKSALEGYSIMPFNNRYYWSATESRGEAVENMGKIAWIVNIGSGTRVNNKKEANYNVRCVRDL